MLAIPGTEGDDKLGIEVLMTTICSWSPLLMGVASTAGRSTLDLDNGWAAGGYIGCGIKTGMCICRETENIYSRLHIKMDWLKKYHRLATLRSF